MKYKIMQAMVVFITLLFLGYLLQLGETADLSLALEVTGFLAMIILATDLMGLTSLRKQMA